MQKLKEIFFHGLALAIPLAVVGYVFLKIHKAFEKIIHPVASKMGIEKLLGELTLGFFAIMLMLVLMLTLGLLMQLKFMASFKKEIEAVALKIFPWLNQLKAMAPDMVELENSATNWKPVLVDIENTYYPAFLVEESQNLVSLFIIKNSKMLEGEMMTTEKSRVTYFPIQVHDIRTVTKQYGKGMIDLIAKLEGYS